MNIANYTIFGRDYINLNDKLVSYYKFEDVLDSINGNSMLLINNPQFLPAKINNGLFFSGALRYATFNDANLSFTNGVTDIPFSFSFWVNTTTISSVGNWVLNKRSTPQNTTTEWQFNISPTNGFRFAKFSQGSQIINQYCNSTSTIIDLNMWYHIVITDDGSSTIEGMNMYVNGILQTGVKGMNGGTYVRMFATSSPIYIGTAGFGPNNTNRHNGFIDELGFWRNRILTQNDVTKLYNSGLGITYPF